MKIKLVFMFFWSIAIAGLFILIQAAVMGNDKIILTNFQNPLIMKNYVFAIIIFIIFWPFFFFSALVYQNSLEVPKRVVRLNFKEISKLDFWSSFFISLLIAAAISYSLI